MKFPPYERGEQSHALPIDLQQLVNQLDIGSVRGAHDASIADIRLTYGQSDQTEVLPYVRDQLTATAGSYIHGAGEVLRAGAPGQHVPQYILEAVSYNENPPFVFDAAQVISWLGVAAKHMPEMADATAKQIIENTVHGFDPQNFQHALGSLDELGRDNSRVSTYIMKRAAQSALRITIGLAAYTTDTDTMRQLRDSSLMEAFGSNWLRLDMQRRIVEQEGPLTADRYYTDDYQALLETLEASLQDCQTILPEGVRALTVIANHTPALISELAGKYPQQAKTIRGWVAETLLAADPEMLTPEHEATLEQLEADAYHDLWAYTHITDQYLKRDGVITAERRQRLVELLTANPDIDPEKRHTRPAILVAAFTPDEELPGLIAERPYLVVDDSAKSIAIRRLARMGAVEQAHALIPGKTTTIDSHALRYTPIKNLLVIYEETGDDRFLAEADQHIAASMDGWLKPSPDDLHEFAARRYVAARRHNMNERARAAAADMEVYHKQPDSYSRRQALSRTVQIHLDNGDIDTAARYALALYKDKEIRNHDTSQSGYAALLEIVSAYAKAGRAQDAVDFIKPHLMKEKPYDYHILWAVELVTSGGTSFKHSIYAARLDPLKTLQSDQA